MKAQTRQTVIGVVALSVVESIALLQGFNGVVTAAYMGAISALLAPEAIDSRRRRRQEER